MSNPGEASRRAAEVAVSQCTHLNFEQVGACVPCIDAALARAVAEKDAEIERLKAALSFYGEPAQAAEVAAMFLPKGPSHALLTERIKAVVARATAEERAKWTAGAPDVIGVNGHDARYWFDECQRLQAKLKEVKEG